MQLTFPNVISQSRNYTFFLGQAQIQDNAFPFLRGPMFLIFFHLECSLASLCLLWPWHLWRLQANYRQHVPHCGLACHPLITCLTSPAADQRLTSLSLPGKRMLSLSPAVPHFDHLIKVVPAAHLHCATGVSLGPSFTAVQWVLCGKVFWDCINVLLLYWHPLILVSLRDLHWIMCLRGDSKSHWEDYKQACVVISKDISEGNV